MRIKRLIPVKRSKEIRKMWSNYKLHLFGIVLYDSNGDRVI